LTGVTGTISANGGSTGSGGPVSISNHGDGGIVVSAPITATGGTTVSGHGGRITLSAAGSRGIQIDSLSNLSVAVDAGDGGTISLSAPQGSISLPGGSISASASGGDFDG